MKVVAIGNSFSEDATRYLHDIAKSDGVELEVINLYIGGCSLFTHYKNITNDSVAYGLQYNGQNTGVPVSVKQVLQSREWDYVTMQQVSQCAPNYETYQPYLDYLAEYCELYAPKAKQLMHQTWAYEEGSKRLCEELGYSHHGEMFADIQEAYSSAAADLGGIGIIPCGAVFEKLIETGIEKVHRDTFHAKLGVGRYALGLTWYGYLTGNDVTKNQYNIFDEPVSDKEIEIVKMSVKQILETAF